MNPKRTKGKRDQTIERILKTSRKIFAEKGFDGARMDEIARRARVNKATIYYHIGDKRTLYGRILKDTFGNIADQLFENDDASCRPDERLRRFVRTLARGRHSVSYRMRAEIPGRFSALPTRVSGMYAPELRANSDEIKLQVSD